MWYEPKIESNYFRKQNIMIDIVFNHRKIKLNWKTRKHKSYFSVSIVFDISSEWYIFPVYKRDVRNLRVDLDISSVKWWDISTNPALSLIHKDDLLKRKARQINYRENSYREVKVKLRYGGGKVTESEMPGQDRWHLRFLVRF